MTESDYNQHAASNVCFFFSYNSMNVSNRCNAWDNSTRNAHNTGSCVLLLLFPLPRCIVVSRCSVRIEQQRTTVSIERRRHENPTSNTNRQKQSISDHQDAQCDPSMLKVGGTESYVPVARSNNCFVLWQETAGTNRHSLTMVGSAASSGCSNSTHNSSYV